MNEIRWTDKVYLDNQGNIRSSDGCPTDQITQDLINKVMTNIGGGRFYYDGTLEEFIERMRKGEKNEHL